MINLNNNYIINIIINLNNNCSVINWIIKLYIIYNKCILYIMFFKSLYIKIYI